MYFKILVGSWWTFLVIIYSQLTDLRRRTISLKDLKLLMFQRGGLSCLSVRGLREVRGESLVGQVRSSLSPRPRSATNHSSDGALRPCIPRVIRAWFSPSSCPSPCPAQAQPSLPFRAKFWLQLL